MFRAAFVARELALLQKLVKVLDGAVQAAVAVCPLHHASPLIPKAALMHDRAFIPTSC